MHDFLVAAGMRALSKTPAPSPGNGGLRPGLSEDQVTPGLLGFVMTAFMVIAVVLLMVSMTRRIRRIRYRAQVSDTEQDDHTPPAETNATDSTSGADASNPAPEPPGTKPTVP